MVNKSYVISTLFAVAGMLALLAIEGLKDGGADGPVSNSHGHKHYHTHDGSTHAHGHDHGGVEAGDAFVASDEGDCEHLVVVAYLPTDPHHGCCHEDHSHPSPVFALTVTGSRWDDHLPSLSCPLPDLWQPKTMCSPVIQPMPPPPRGCPADSISQLRTVVMLT